MKATSISAWIRSNVLGFVAIFIALSGTAAASLPGTNTVDSGDIINGEVRNPDIRDGAVTGGKIGAGQVQSSDLAADSVTGAKVADGSLTGTDLNEATLGLVPNADALDGISSGGFWQLGGNAGTTSADFLGTTDNTALNLRVNNARGLRIEPASDGTNQSPNVIGGSADNAVTPGVHSATIGGGGRSSVSNPASANRVTDDKGTVGGGVDNQAGDADATFTDAGSATVGGGSGNTASGVLTTVGGGSSNTASVNSATIGGGFDNEANGGQSTVGGGQSNTAGGQRATVGGGISNEASASDATVPGGRSNTAAGVQSFAAGNRAKANNQGAFVWGDSQLADIASTANNQFIARAAGHFFLQSDSSLDDQGGFLNTSTGAFLSTGGTWTNNSDVNLKRDFEPVGPREVLSKVAALPVRSWQYKAEPGVRHVGPTAQDFYAAFGLGGDDRHIASIDADGVSLAAIKGLQREVRVERRQRHEQDRRIAHLEVRLAALARKGR